MKRRMIWIFQMLLLLAADKVSSQSNDMQMFASQPYPLELTTAKTTHIVFPYDIISVDRGSRAILAQKAKGTSNILQVKAAIADFDQSSLTVITADKKLYSFVVDYAAQPLQLTIEFIGSGLSPGVLLEDSGVNQAEIQKLSKKVLHQPKRIRGVKDKSFKSSLTLNGIYIEKDVIYYQLEMANHAQVSYDIGSVRFFIRDKQRVKRSALQELEIRPLHIAADTAVIAGKSTHTFVFAFAKFTISGKKYLAIEVMEKNGGRHLRLGVSGRRIAGARVIED